MKIIYIHQYFATRNDAGGTRSYEFSRQLIEAGHQVTMITASADWAISREGGSAPASFDYEGIKVLQSPVRYSTQQSFFKRIFSFLRFIPFVYQMALQEKDAAVVFATSTPLTVAIPGLLASRKLRVPFVFEVRDLWPDGPKKSNGMNPVLYWLSKKLELWTYRNAVKIIVLAPGVGSAIAQMGLPERRIIFIPNAADLDLFRPPAERKLASKISLIFTGAHGKPNGLDAVLDAAEELQRRSEEGIRFLLIGKGGQKERLIARSREMGLRNVEFRDAIPKLELAELLRKMDVGMMILRNMPHFYDGTSPNKFFDYIATGMPVLINYPGWLASVVNRECCGISVEPDDPAAFANAVIYLRDHPEERARMGEQARIVAEKMFDRRKLADKFVQTISKSVEDFRARQQA